ncbi:MAG: hypothetical protein A2729_03140 [Candidatus Buchananbacteria bacterium RIFCSPHIGHO2_01_FULL_39_14]|uniref:DUF86 domain-containing protein n=1 Tax=Candidatus Buchananbacteria bacterium RIFCSPHIGHO2_01_FULL_39_14 TaxID=1797532 RepID=A0A1G1XSD0_9BACT|nr:MAG: hypothetical protein A2729_03140 [Candidatus Buchananbacteria bacterium RIFCSPHIGHO2_01_FULL_39_14]OGY49136.1 MAG: hypothetical protein A3D39_05825 [Candidatus Buchananbacteria bacterium RIFCSPHIGHO2_02_FULL_39_17]
MPKNKRDYNLYIADIEECIKSIELYTKDLTFEKFKNNKMAIDAVVRNIEIIGEAANNIPKEIKVKHSEVPWNKIIGMRNKIIHEYFGVDIKIIWKTIQRRIPELKKLINKIKSYR